MTLRVITLFSASTGSVALGSTATNFILTGRLDAGRLDTGRLVAGLFIVGLIVTGQVGCRSIGKVVAPSNVRNWSPEYAVLPYAEFSGDRALVHNVRNNRYFGDDAMVIQHEDRIYDLNHLQGVDFVMVPFEGTPSLAHTMLSFEFVDPAGAKERLALSIETRREAGETYAAWKGSLRQFELMYVLADERDVIELRTNHRHENVYVYRTTAQPEQARRLFIDVLGRANELAVRPEFYDTLTNNCTSNLVRHVNRIAPRRLQQELRLLLPGFSDQLAFEEGLILPRGTFEETKAAAYVNPRAYVAAGRADFSEQIRR